MLLIDQGESSEGVFARARGTCGFSSDAGRNVNRDNRASCIRRETIERWKSSTPVDILRKVVYRRRGSRRSICRYNHAIPLDGSRKTRREQHPLPRRDLSIHGPCRREKPLSEEITESCNSSRRGTLRISGNRRGARSSYRDEQVSVNMGSWSVPFLYTVSSPVSSE